MLRLIRIDFHKHYLNSGANAYYVSPPIFRKCIDGLTEVCYPSPMSQSELEQLADLLHKLYRKVQKYPYQWTQPQAVLTSLSVVLQTVREEINESQKSQEDQDRFLENLKTMFELRHFATKD